MKTVFFRSVPYDKHAVTLALESGVNGLIVPAAQVSQASSLARCTVLADEDIPCIALHAKEDEERVARMLQQGQRVLLARGWEVIPVENLLAVSHDIAVEVDSLEEAHLAAGILERGVDTVVVSARGTSAIKAIVQELTYTRQRMDLLPATIMDVQHAGLGHRVCVDTMSLMCAGQGMLVGNSSAFTFLVNAESERNEYVAARPFRVNAGAVHAYAVLPEDATCYLDELKAGARVLVVDHAGATGIATVGRVKTEVRPMLLVRARVQTPQGHTAEGAVFLQNAETIRLVHPDGTPVSIVSLQKGDEVLVRTDTAGRHFGMRIAENIREE